MSRRLIIVFAYLSYGWAIIMAISGQPFDAMVVAVLAYVVLESYRA